MSAPPLPPFSGDDTVCPKCQHKGASTRYMALGRCLHDSGDTIGFAKNERLHRECTRCGYAWDEALAEPTGGSR
jgi:rubredoxin